MTPKQLYTLGEETFKKRSSLTSLWQEQAENFYPERADFTIRRYLGHDFAGNLTTSYPILCRRDLQDQMSVMLRPTNKSWFHTVLKDTKVDDNETKRWLQFFEKVQRRAMYDRLAHFTRATKQCDGDFATFGQGVISVELNRDKSRLLYRCWHLRDMAWIEDADGNICAVWRKWKAMARDLQMTFGDKIDAKVKKLITENKPFEPVECMHMMVTADLWDGKANGKPWVSVSYDCQHEFVMEEEAMWGRKYVIPRWQTVSGSQYAFSPATVAALPEARLIQAMTYTILEAGEKATNPPMIAAMDVVKSNIEIYAGGTTWIDSEYDERMGDALRPITQDKSALPFSQQMQADSRQLIAQCFYLNKLTLPQRAPEMTAYEVGQRIQEYIRGALPLFEPMEADYNGAICDESFDLLWRNGAFGSPLDWPKTLRGGNVEFQFESPLHDAIEGQKGQLWLQGKELIAEAVALDRKAAAIPNGVDALRDVLDGIGWPAKWMHSESEVDTVAAEMQKQAAQQEQLNAMKTGSEAAANIGVAQKNLQQAAA